MPLYIGTYLTDTTDLTTEQHGAHFLLLLTCWKRQGYLPDNDGQLQAITRLRDQAWTDSRDLLRGFFTPTGDGRLTQKRLLAEYLDAVERYGKRIASSQAAIAARAAKQPNGEPNGRPNGASNGASNGQHNNKDKDNASTKQKKPLVPPSASRFAEFWDAYPKAGRKGKQAALKKWQARGLDAIADRILADVRDRLAKDRQWREGYIPHASTYVNGSGWEDAIDDSAPKVALAANGRPETVPNPQGTSPAVKETAKTKLAGAVSFVNQQLDLGLMDQKKAAEYLKPYQEAARAASHD